MSLNKNQKVPFIKKYDIFSVAKSAHQRSRMLPDASTLQKSAQQWCDSIFSATSLLSEISAITVTLMQSITGFILLTFSLIRLHVSPALLVICLVLWSVIPWNIQILSETSWKKHQLAFESGRVRMASLASAAKLSHFHVKRLRKPQTGLGRTSFLTAEAAQMTPPTVTWKHNSERLVNLISCQ